MLVVIEFFLSVTPYKFFKNYWIYYKLWLISVGKIFSTTLLFLISKIKFSVAGIVKPFFYKTIIFEDYLLIFNIRNDRVAETIFPGKIGYKLWKFNHFCKLVRSDSKEKFYYKERCTGFLRRCIAFVMNLFHSNK